MLRMVFFTLLIIGGARRWAGVGLRFFLGGFLIILGGLREYCVGGLGSLLGVDFVAHVLILLRF